MTSTTLHYHEFQIAEDFPIGSIVSWRHGSWMAEGTVEGFDKEKNKVLVDRHDHFTRKPTGNIENHKPQVLFKGKIEEVEKHLQQLDPEQAGAAAFESKHPESKHPASKQKRYAAGTENLSDFKDGDVVCWRRSAGLSEGTVEGTADGKIRINRHDRSSRKPSGNYEYHHASALYKGTLEEVDAMLQRE